MHDTDTAGQAHDHSADTGIGDSIQKERGTSTIKGITDEVLHCYSNPGVSLAFLVLSVRF